MVRIRLARCVTWPAAAATVSLSCFALVRVSPTGDTTQIAVAALMLVVAIVGSANFLAFHFVEVEGQHLRASALLGLRRAEFPLDASLRIEWLAEDNVAVGESAVLELSSATFRIRLSSARYAPRDLRRLVAAFEPSEKTLP